MNRRFVWMLSAALVACSPDAPRDGKDAGPGSAPPGAGLAPDGAGAAFQEPSEAPRGPRVVFLGTSLTAGMGLESAEDGYVSRLQLLADSAGTPMQAVNAGVSGDTSAGGLRRLEWILRGPLDVLFVELGANDGLRGQDPDATAANLRAIVALVRARYPGARILIAAMEAPPNLGDDYIRRFRAVFPAVAGETGAGLVPFFLEGVAGVPELNQDDGIHPTPQGNVLMATNVWPFLQPVLQDWWAGEGAR